MWGVRPSEVARWSYQLSAFFIHLPLVQSIKAMFECEYMPRRTNREFLRHDTTSDGRVVATWGWVVVAEASYERGGLRESFMASPAEKKGR